MTTKKPKHLHKPYILTPARKRARELSWALYKLGGMRTNLALIQSNDVTAIEGGVKNPERLKADIQTAIYYLEVVRWKFIDELKRKDWK